MHENRNYFFLTDQLRHQTVWSSCRVQWRRRSESMWFGWVAHLCLQLSDEAHGHHASRIQVTYSKVKLPSPVKAPFGIDVIWLPDRYLFMTLKWCTHTWRVTDSSNKQRSQVAKTSEGAVRYRCDFVGIQGPVYDTEVMHTDITLLSWVTNRTVKLPRPKKAPLEIDVSWLICKYLYTSL